MSLISELQRDCLDENADPMTLLRKAFLVARKLEIEDFAEWIQLEMYGYAGHEVPTYRVVYGKMMAKDQFERTLPVVLPKNFSFLCERHVINSIASIHGIIKSNDKTVKMAFPNDIDATLVELFKTDYPFHLEIGVDQFEEIEQCVINKVLEWALVLENKGILGDELSFSEEEKTIAKSDDVVRQTNIIIYGDVTNSQIQQDTQDSGNSNF